MIHIKILLLSFSILFLAHSTLPYGHGCVEDVYTMPMNYCINVLMNVLLLLIRAVKGNAKMTT